MKSKIKSKIKILLSVAFLSASLVSCIQDDVPGSELDQTFVNLGDVYQNGNPDKIDYKNEVTEIGFKEALVSLDKILGSLKTAQYYLHGGKDGKAGQEHRYQLQFNLSTDNFCGYLCPPQNFQGRLKSIYYYHGDFNDGPFDAFLSVKNTIAPLLNHPDIDSIPEIKAVGLMLYSYASQEVADIYGPFAYKDLLLNKQAAPFHYNTVEEIYRSVINNLDTIVAAFENFEYKAPWYKQGVEKILAQQDVITNKSIDNWKKFANSLKLRMAMHVVKSDPISAKLWAEQAVASGVIDSPDTQVALQITNEGADHHPLVFIGDSWNDTRLNASFESILKSFKHPMLVFLFDQNAKDIPTKDGASIALPAHSRIQGLRGGIRTIPRDGGQNIHVNYSKPSSKINFDPLCLIKYSEVLFLRAEGAIRGWNMAENPATLYENGIRHSFAGTENGYFFSNIPEEGDDDYDYDNPPPTSTRVEDYLQLTDAVDFTYEDPNNSKNNIKSLTKIGVKWNDADDLETKLEKIITQKYIANYPYSFESWTDIRRTGYPRIFPVRHDDGDGSIMPGDIIRRLRFPGQAEESVKADVFSSGIPALEASDRQGTRLWWDKAGVANF